MSAVSILKEMLERYPALNTQEDSIFKAFQIISESYKNGGKLMLCGNGGSCSDCDHIVGELMKSFKFKRKIDTTLYNKLASYGDSGKLLADNLEGNLPAINLCQHTALSTAFANDTNPQLSFAQQLLGYGKSGDVLMAISTSGNSKNCVFAAILAKQLGITVISLVGSTPCKLDSLSDTVIKAPETETYRVQEYHLPIYHALCAMLEDEFFTA